MLKAPQRFKAEKGKEYILPMPVLYDPENYVFAGWLDEKNGKIYQSGDKYIAEDDTFLIAKWDNTYVCPDVCSLSVCSYCDGFFRHLPTATLTKGAHDGIECLKIVPTPDDPKEETVILDGYHCLAARIDLSFYRYAALIIKYEGKSPKEYTPMLTFPQNGYGIQNYSVEVNADGCVKNGEWSIVTFDMKDVAASLVDKNNAVMRQMYIYPYGKTPATELPADDVMYVAKLMFFKNEPDVKICTERLSECLADDTQIAKDLLCGGVTKDFADTDIVYITESGKYISLLTDVATLCNSNLVPDTDAGAKFMAELDERTSKRIAEIRNTETAVKVTGTKYYVSVDGNDDNDGLSPDAPWKTTVKVSEAELKPGDGVFFKRGDTWRNVAINAKAGVTYSAYGVGAKPNLYGSPENGADASKWSLWYKDGSKKIWLYDKELSDVGLMVFNDGESYTTKAIPSYINEKFVLRDEPETEFDIKEHLDDMMLFSEIIPAGVWVSKRKGKLYLRCDKGNPGEIYDSIEFNTRSQLIELGSNPDVTVDNLCLKYTGSIAVHAWDATEKPARAIKNMTVTNCEIGWIGGGIQMYNVKNGQVIRLGNGVEIYGGCDGYIIDNCYIYQCYDAGFTVQCGSGAAASVGTMKNATFSNIVAEYCIYGTELWNGSSEKVYGRVGENINVVDNIIRYCGYGFGQQRYNKGNATSIMGFHHENIFKDYHVKNNVFALSRDNLLNTTSEYNGTLPIYEGNTYVQNVGGNLGYLGLGRGNLYTYDMTAKATIENIFGDKNAAVYYVK